MAASVLFKGCERSIVDRIGPHVEAHKVARGTVVLKTGAAEPMIGLVYAGALVARSVNAITGASTVLEQIRPGDVFGEVSAVLGTAQTAEIFVEQDSVVALISKDLLTQLLTKVAPFATAVAKRLANRVMLASVAAMRSTANPASGHQAADAPMLDLRLDGLAVPGAAGATTSAGATPGGAEAAGGVTPFVRTSAYAFDKKLLELVPAKLIQQHRVLPLELAGRRLTVGMVDPFNAGSVAELRRVVSAADVHIAAIASEDFNEAMVRLRLDQAGPKARPAEMISADQIAYDATDQERDAKREVGVIGDEVVMLASKIIATAISTGASDIHIESDLTGVRVRFRSSGTLVDWDQFVPPSFAKSLVARFKVLAGLDITERRLPQDGRIGMKIGKREVDARISTMPASRGEKIVMRLFEAASLSRPLDAIIHEPSVLKELRAAINRPYGAVIIAGPTGSGKSSTMYGALGERKKTRADTSIATVEDPIEYRLSGITQTQVNHAAGLSFDKVLRAMLRQDPDIIMVGESRDPETAQLALEAAMTGHLLFTSLHANNAMGVVQRLEQLGCRRPLIAQALGAVLVQRLARRPCPRCVSTETPPPMLLETLAQRGLIEKSTPVPLPRANGCPECNHTGFAGRIAVVEYLVPTDTLRAQLMADMPLADLEQAAIATGTLTPFKRYASYLMSRNLLTPTEALLVVA